MLSGVKECIEKQDIRGLRYIFVDSLDVDPTFEKYKADYEYCKNIKGLFDPYQEMTPLWQDEHRWNRDYWNQLKKDLMKNYSLKRFEHMRKVAPVVYAEKVSRLLAERKEEERKEEERIVETKRQLALENQRLEEEQRKKAQKAAPVAARAVSPAGDAGRPSGTVIRDKNQEEEERIAEAKRQLALENQKWEEEQRKKARRSREEAYQPTEEEQISRAGEQTRRTEAPAHVTARQTAPAGDSESKKWLGIVIGIVAVAVIVIIVLAIM
ncbi:MAG: hypothetical protein HFJ05_09060 [Eubacterium sp.]|nr:hypothetical protein [Eubacterium sp.]